MAPHSSTLAWLGEARPGQSSLSAGTAADGFGTGPVRGACGAPGVQPAAAVPAGHRQCPARGQGRQQADPAPPPLLLPLHCLHSHHQGEAPHRLLPHPARLPPRDHREEGGVREMGESLQAEHQSRGTHSLPLSSPCAVHPSRLCPRQVGPG